MKLKFESRAVTARQKQNFDIIEALNRSQAVIEFQPDGTILDANANFLAALGYRLEEVVGRHHSMFVTPDEQGSRKYAGFWSKLAQGEFQAATFRRLAKGGKDVWIEATYNPLVAPDGSVYKVVKFASDVTEKQLRAADARGQLSAISRSQAVIEFDLDGIVLSANENFCNAMGYELAEIVGKHHRLFMLAQDAAHSSYAEFWRRLRSGEYFSTEYMRLGKGGRQVWIQASYNPILNANGQPYKVVKYATDITARKTATNELWHGLELLAQGKLSCSIAEPFVGEMEQVRLAFNRTVERISAIVREIRETTESLRLSAGDIRSGADELSIRTAGQNSAIETTLDAVELLCGTVDENASRTELARSNTRKVSIDAQQTGAVMSEANLAMQEVTAQSQKISKVIGLIDDIAFQTNLLALNASVEAARAGDAGKGFAVVAVEVRRLAQSAAGASNEVKMLIEQTSSAVTKGTRLVATAGVSLDSIAEQVEDNANLIELISGATDDQIKAIDNVRREMSRMEQSTKQNANLVEQTRSSVEATDSQSTQVKRLVDVFVLDHADAGGGIMAPRALSRAS